jgi:hypothetical protein
MFQRMLVTSSLSLLERLGNMVGMQRASSVLPAAGALHKNVMPTNALARACPCRSARKWSAGIRACYEL